MAKNWLAAEAAGAIINGTTEEKQDIGRRFPLFAQSVAANSSNPNFLKFAAALPAYLTARKIE